jgi:phosphohistidine phosphatase
MKYLTIVRHAKAQLYAEQGGDHERALSERGQRAAVAMGRFLGDTYWGKGDEVAKLPEVEGIYCSSALRTRQTLEKMALESVLQKEIDKQYLELLYLAEVEELLKQVQHIDEGIHHAMIVGHNPGVFEFCNQLLARESLVRMPTCGVVILSLPVPYWGMVDHGIGHLIGLLTPRMLEKCFPKKFEGITEEDE